MLDSLMAPALARAGQRGAEARAMPAPASPADAIIQQIQAQQQAIAVLEEQMAQAESQRERIDAGAEIGLRQRIVITLADSLGPPPGMMAPQGAPADGQR